MAFPYANGSWVNEPFNDRTNPDDLNTRRVHNSDPQCTIFMPVIMQAHRPKCVQPRLGVIKVGNYCLKVLK